MWRFDTPYSNELKHYASPYYDPAKAHQYYEEHKQLKGRQKHTTLNEKGKEIAANVKQNINEERDHALKTVNTHYSNEQKQRSQQHSNSVKQHAKILNERIESMRNALKRMSPADKKEQAPKIKAMIYKLRKANDEKRSQLMARYKTESETARNQHKELSKSIRTAASDEYSREHEKIAAEYAKTRK